MSHCMVPQCSNGWRKTKGTDITYHRLPSGCEISRETTRENQSTHLSAGFSVVQVTEATSSNAMEYEGCTLLQDNIPVRCLTTDRHTTVTARIP